MGKNPPQQDKSQLVPTEQGCQTYRLQLVDLHTKPRVTAL